MSYYLLPALPFVAVALARALDQARARWLAPAYVGIALALFAASYPVLAAVPLAEGTLRRYQAVLGAGP